MVASDFSGWGTDPISRLRPVVFVLGAFIALVGLAPGVAASAEPAELPSAWSVVEPLEQAGTTAAGESSPVATFGSMLNKALLHRKSDTSLHRFFNRYTEGFSNLNLSSLYYNENIDWETVGTDAKRIRYRGEPRDAVFRFTTEGVTEPLRKTGSSTTQITIRSLEDAFRLSTYRRVNVGPLDERTTMTMIRRILEFLDFNRRAGSLEKKELLRLYTDRINRDLPALSGYIEKFVDFKTVGSPGDSTAPSAVNLTYTIDGGAFAQHYPEFHRVYHETLLPSGLSVTVQDSSGRRLFNYTRDGKKVSWKFHTREGRIVPHEDGRPLSDTGYTPAQLRKMTLVSRTSSWMTIFGLYFGMDEMTFRSSYENGEVTWRLTEAPGLNLPWGIRLLLSPFLSPFLNYLETGNQGGGLTYTESFRRKRGTVFHVERLKLPLKDSPIIPFMLKLYNLAWSPLNEAAWEDLKNLGRNLSSRFQEDYRRYRKRDREGRLVETGR